jgi:hypothetical protein
MKNKVEMKLRRNQNIRWLKKHPPPIPQYTQDWYEKKRKHHPERK